MNNKNNKPSLSTPHAGTDYVALTDICQPKQWKTIPMAELKATGYPVYGANGIIGYSDEYNHENKTILIACRGASCGAINVCLPKSYVTGNAMCLDGLSEEFDLYFLQHYLQAYDFKQVISGSAQPQITRSGLNSVMVPILPTSSQRRISRILNVVDENRKQAEHAVNYLDTLIKSRFIEMFGDPNHSHSHNAVCLENAFDIRDDLRKPLNSKTRSEMKVGELYPYYGANGIVDYINTFITDCDALCFAEDCGSYGADEQSTYIVRGKAWINNHAHFLLAKPCCILEWANVYFCLLDIGKMISGTTRSKLTQAQLKRIMIDLPPLALQQEFAAFVSQVDKLRFATQQQIEKLETLKKSLMQEYFN